MAALPTWDGQTVTQDKIIAVSRAAFDLVLEDMTGAPILTLTKVELLHLLEAGSYLYWMGTYATSVALTAARDAGASWAELGSAMGVSSSSAKYRYERQARESDDA
jgi:hypothetical protein